MPRGRRSEDKADSARYVTLLEISSQAVIRIDADDPKRLSDLKSLSLSPNMLGINAGGIRRTEDGSRPGGSSMCRSPWRAAGRDAAPIRAGDAP